MHLPFRPRACPDATRQAEALLEIRDATILFDTWLGFNVGKLINGCYEARFDLSEADEEWLTALRLRSATSVKRRDAGKLARLAAELGIIENQDAA